MTHTMHTIHKYLFYTFIFLLPWHTIYIIREIFYGSEKWQYGTLSIYTSDVILILWIILSIYLYKDKILEYIPKKQKLITIALLFSLWSFLSILWANNQMIAFYFAIKLSFALDLFFLVQIVPLNIRKISIVFVLSTLLQSILGILQFITQQTFAQKFLGLQFHDVWHGGSAIINIDGERWLRLYGTAPHPNIFGGVLLCALLLCIYLYTTSSQNNLQKAFLLISTALFTTGILFTFSRTIWVASILSLLLTTIFIYKKTYLKLKNIITPLVLIFATILLVIGLYQNIFLSRTTKDTSLAHNSISDRALYIDHAKYLIFNNSLVGTGVGNYTNTIYTASTNNHPIWYYQPVHNIYLLITSEIGLIGIILFIIFILSIFYNIYLHRRNIKLEQFVFIILFISFLFISIFDHWPWTSHFGLFILFLLASLSIKKSHFYK